MQVLDQCWVWDVEPITRQPRPVFSRASSGSGVIRASWSIKPIQRRIKSVSVLSDTRITICSLPFQQQKKRNSLYGHWLRQHSTLENECAQQISCSHRPQLRAITYRNPSLTVSLGSGLDDGCYGKELAVEIDAQDGWLSSSWKRDEIENLLWAITRVQKHPPRIYSDSFFLPTAAKKMWPLSITRTSPSLSHRPQRSNNTIICSESLNHKFCTITFNTHTEHTYCC